MTSYDAVVIGAGPNGLVAANRLVDAGWSVLVLEAQDELGGAVHSDRELDPGFVHDTFSAFYPLAAASPAIRDLELEKHGLTWQHAPAPLGHVFRDGSWGLIHRDRETTAALADAQHAGDGAAWLETCRVWDAIGDGLVGSLLTPFPPVKPVPGLLRGLVRSGGLQTVRTLLTPATQLAESTYGGAGLRGLLAGSAGHADIPLDAPGSGLMALLMTMLAQTVGFPVPTGGAGELSAALARRLRAAGGEIRLGSAVDRLEVASGRVRRVRTAGESVDVDRAVIAGVTALQLFGGPGFSGRPLLDPGDVPSRVRRGMAGFVLDPGTVKVDWALDAPVPWAERPAYQPGTVHVANSLAEMSESLGQVAAGAVPRHPLLLAGQMTTTDPTRSPQGTESFWAYAHVPQKVRHDAGDAGITGSWDSSECERFADRMQARIEERAPGFGDRVRARRVLGPRELEARNANLVGGAIGAGTAQLHQQLVFRPVPGLGRAETGIAGLYLGSASAHPGGGVHGAAGMNAARAALAHDRSRRLLHRRPRAGSAGGG